MSQKPRSSEIQEKTALANAMTSDDILGKHVIDPEGEFIGIVDCIHIDSQSIDIMGLSVDKGFLKKGLVIGRDYIDSITPYAVFLSIVPSHNIKGMTVFDADGHTVGKVTAVHLQSGENAVEELKVSRGIRGDEVQISPEQIAFIGHNVFLSEKWTDTTMQ